MKTTKQWTVRNDVWFLLNTTITVEPDKDKFLVKESGKILNRLNQQEAITYAENLNR